MRNLVSRGRASRIAGVMVGLGLALSSTSVASANVTFAVGWTAPGTIAVGASGQYSVRFWTDAVATRYYQVIRQTPANDDGALGVSLTSDCVGYGGSLAGATINHSIGTTVGQTVPGQFHIRLRVQEYSDAGCTTARSSGYNFIETLDVETTIFVVPDAKTVRVGDPAPAYTFTMHSNSPTGAVWTHATASHYRAPTCTSAYTASTPASASPVTIHCTGGSHRDLIFVGVDGQLTINKFTPSLAFAAIDDKVVGDDDFSVAGLVTLDEDNDGELHFGEGSGSTGCEVSPEGMVRITGAGTCTVEVTVAATAKYNAGGPVAQSFDISAPEPTATPTPTPTPMQEVEAVTAQPTQAATPAPTSTAPDAPGSSTPLFALLICLAFAGLGLLSVSAQRRGIRD